MTSPHVIALAPFGRTERDQHLLDDDAYYAAFLADLSLPLTYIAGEASASRLSKQMSGRANVCVETLPLRSGRWAFEWQAQKMLKSALQRVPKGQSVKVIFFGYSETLALMCAPVLRLYGAEVDLVNTNNIAPPRVTKYRHFMRLLHAALGPQLRRFIVHTAFEKRLVETTFPRLIGRTVVKGHHMLLSDPVRIAKRLQRSRDHWVVSCFGPIRADKSPEVLNAVLAHLAERETSESIQVKLYKVDPEQVVVPDGAPDVTFHTDFMEHDVYRDRIAESDLVILAHTPSFEGKLSGILCDCLSLAVPYTGIDIEPLTEFNQSFGEMGILLSHDDPAHWHEAIAKVFDPKVHQAQQTNLMRYAAEANSDQLQKAYAQVFGLA